MTNLNIAVAGTGYVYRQEYILETIRKMNVTLQ